jgi:hypothetical protein
MSHQKADAQYNYHCCDGLKHERPPARPFFSNEGSVRTVKEIHRATAVGFAIEDFRQHALVQRLAGKLARFVNAFGGCTDGTAVDALARLGASPENASGRSLR